MMKGNFFFFTFFFTFLQNIWSAKEIAKLYIWRRGGRRQRPTAVGHGGRGPVSFQKFVIYCLNSDGDKFYMKIVAFDKIYNFVVQSFSI
jgi:hypothetical protein